MNITSLNLIHDMMTNTQSSFRLRTLACWGCGAPLLSVWITADGRRTQQLETRVTLKKNHRVAEQRVAGLNPGYRAAAGIWERDVNTGVLSGIEEELTESRSMNYFKK